MSGILFCNAKTNTGKVIVSIRPSCIKPGYYISKAGDAALEYVKEQLNPVISALEIPLEELLIYIVWFVSIIIFILLIVIVWFAFSMGVPSVYVAVFVLIFLFMAIIIGISIYSSIKTNLSNNLRKGVYNLVNKMNDINSLNRLLNNAAEQYLDP